MVYRVQLSKLDKIRQALGPNIAIARDSGRRSDMGLQAAVAGELAPSERRDERRISSRSVPSTTLSGKVALLFKLGLGIYWKQRIIRKTLWEAVDGLPFTHKPSIHTDHCFDALRQVSRLLSR